MHQWLLFAVHFAILVVFAAHALPAFGINRLLLLCFVHFTFFFFCHKTFYKVLLATISLKVLRVICTLNLEFLWSLLKLCKVIVKAFLASKHLLLGSVVGLKVHLIVTKVHVVEGCKLPVSSGAKSGEIFFTR